MQTVNSTSRRRHVAFAAVVVTCVSAACLAAAELLLRHIDGYRLSSIRLVRLPSPNGVDEPFREKWVDPQETTDYVRRFEVSAGVDPSWYWLSPPRYPKTPVDRDLLDRMNGHPQAQLPSVYVWNVRYARRAICTDKPRDEAVFSRLSSLFLFHSTSGPFPSYRFVRSAHYPTGLHTNNFGWRGRDIALRKPAGTVRIAFLGASTTAAAHSEPYSYPELVERWLNRWAESRQYSIAFESIVGAREGIDSKSITALARDEVLPVDPDVAVYYEGSNQFWPSGFVKGVVESRPLDTLQPWRGPLDPYLVISRRMHRVRAALGLEGGEPKKPPLVVEWPKDLSEADPDLADPRLPVDLPQILSDLDKIRHALAQQGAELILTSFNWLVYDGLVLNRQRDEMLYEYLNGSLGGFSYAHLRRYADFQNRVFAKYARVHALDFIDFAAAYPRDPRLFYDPIHMTTAGIRLQAWVMFNRLVPLIERRLAAHRLPRGPVVDLEAHPAFAESDRRTTPTSEIRAACALSDD